MYSLTICFGPTGTSWAFLFKERGPCVIAAEIAAKREGTVEIEDDFGQLASIYGPSIHGQVVEDLEQVEAARIYRSLAEERLKVNLMEAARADPTIRAAMNQQRPPVLTPMGGGFR